MKIVSKAILVNAFVRMTWKKGNVFQKKKKKRGGEPSETQLKCLLKLKFLLRMK